MFEIKTYNAIAPEGLNLLNADQFALNSGANPDGIILRSEKLHGMEFPESLKAIAVPVPASTTYPLKNVPKQVSLYSTRLVRTPTRLRNLFWQL